MEKTDSRPIFKDNELVVVNNAVAMAEELVSNYFKMSASQWLRPKFDVKTLVDLSESEVVDGPFAQIIRYQGKIKGGVLGSSAYDFYKICIQDHAILNTIEKQPELMLALLASMWSPMNWCTSSVSAVFCRISMPAKPKNWPKNNGCIPLRMTSSSLSAPPELTSYLIFMRPGEPPSTELNPFPNFRRHFLDKPKT